MINVKLEMSAARQLNGGAPAPRVQFGAPSRRSSSRASGVPVAEPTTRASLAAPGAGALPIFMKTKILIVEDDIFMGGLLEKKFQQSNFQVARAMNVDEARKVLRALLVDGLRMTPRETPSGKEYAITGL